MPFVPRRPDHPTRLYSEERVVRGYKTYLMVETKNAKEEFKDHYGLFLDVRGGPFPCKAQFAFELVHHDWNPESAVKGVCPECVYDKAGDRGYPELILKDQLASPDNNPYVNGGYLTFSCTFKLG